MVARHLTPVGPIASIEDLAAGATADREGRLGQTATNACFKFLAGCAFRDRPPPLA
jgi:hypothetical protein